MRLRLRLLLYFLRALLRPRLTPWGCSIIRLRVLPNDVDLMHVTNDRYLAYMDLGRNDYAIRLGLLTACRRLRAYPSVRSCTVRFRRAARLFQRVELHTRLLCWDEEAAWFEQEFFVAGRSLALGYCHAEMRTREANVPVATLLAQAGYPEAISPQPSGLVRMLQRQEQALRDRQHADARGGQVSTADA